METPTPYNLFWLGIGGDPFMYKDEWFITRKQSNNYVHLYRLRTDNNRKPCWVLDSSMSLDDYTILTNYAHPVFNTLKGAIQQLQNNTAALMAAVYSQNPDEINRAFCNVNEANGKVLSFVVQAKP